MNQPGFYFFPGDYLVETIGWSHHQQGMYINLLILQFNKGRFTEEQAQAVCLGEFETIQTAFVKDESGMLYNERLERQLEKKMLYCENQRNNIKKRWEKYERNTNVLQSNYERNTKAHTKPIPPQEEKEKEKKEVYDKGTSLVLSSGRGVQGRGKASAGFTKPIYDEVLAYCIERKNSINPQQFIDHYESNGWLVGKVPMKDWRAAVRNWERNGVNNRPANNSRAVPLSEIAAQAERVVLK